MVEHAKVTLSLDMVGNVPNFSGSISYALIQWPSTLEPRAVLQMLNRLILFWKFHQSRRLVRPRDAPPQMQKSLHHTQRQGRASLTCHGANHSKEAFQSLD